MTRYKTMLIYTSLVIVGSSSVAQETLQTVTDRGNTTTKRISISTTTQPESRLTVYGLNNGYFDVYNNANNSVSLAMKRSDGADVFHIDGHSMNAHFGGNVGIGTSDPGSRKLKVITSSSANDVGAEISITRTIGNNYGLISEAAGVGADINTGVFATAGGGNINYGIRIYNIQSATNNYALYSDSQAKSFFAGNVGIGTTTPSEKLSVNGNIRAKEIKVENNNWPDYVFAEGYKLPSLSETARHIKEKGHLPGIPSASEVQANGVELGEMNKKLLEKIEELTLHLIAIEKVVEHQSKEINLLKSAPQRSL